MSSYGRWSPFALQREIVKLPRFNVQDTGYRPSNERVQSKEIKSQASTSVAQEAAGRRKAHLGRK